MPDEFWTPEELCTPDALRLMNWGASHKVSRMLLHYWLKRGWDMSDLVQESFIKAMKNPPPKNIALSTACVRAVLWTAWRRSVVCSAGKKYPFGDFYLRNSRVPMVGQAYTQSTWESDSNLHRALESLPIRNRNIIKLRFGFGCEPMTLEQIGKKLGITRERVRQIEERGLHLLRTGHRRKMILGEESNEGRFVSQEKVGQRWRVSGIYDVGR